MLPRLPPTLWALGCLFVLGIALVPWQAVAQRSALQLTIGFVAIVAAVLGWVLSGRTRTEAR